MDLTQVSRTALLLLICRAVEAEKRPAQFPDPMSVSCLERMLQSVSEEDRKWLLLQKRRYAGAHENEARAGTRRGQTIDRLAGSFISAHPGATVVNLACGFDTRYWRIDHHDCTFIDLDLPEVIRLRKECFGDAMDQRSIGKSVLDLAWLDEVTKKSNSNILLIAEGLVMWLPRLEVINLFNVFSARLTQSQVILDVVPEAWTRGLLRAVMRLNSKLDWGLDVTWQSGVKNPHEIETYADGIRVTGLDKGSFGPIITATINANLN